MHFLAANLELLETERRAGHLALPVNEHRAIRGRKVSHYFHIVCISAPPQHSCVSLMLHQKLLIFGWTVESSCWLKWGVQDEAGGSEDNTQISDRALFILDQKTWNDRKISKLFFQEAFSLVRIVTNTWRLCMAIKVNCLCVCVCI